MCAPFLSRLLLPTPAFKLSPFAYPRRRCVKVCFVLYDDVCGYARDVGDLGKRKKKHWRILNLFLCLTTVGTTQSWLKVPFSAGDFQGVRQRVISECAAETTEVEQEDPEEGESLQTAVFLCPQEGFVRVFQRLSSLKRHLSLDACTKTLERQTLADTAKVQYASLLQEGAGSIPTFIQTSPNTDGVTLKSSLQEGWALMSTKKIY